MTRFPTPSALVAAGLAGLSGAAVSAEIAWLHMRWTAGAYGVICGGGATAHCAACPTALGLLGLGLAALAAAAAAARRPARARQATRPVSERM